MHPEKKIGVVSIWDISNYGNRLQNYGMQYALRKLGWDPYTLKMWPQKKSKRIVQYLTNYDVSILRMLILRCRGKERKYRSIMFERTYISKDRAFYDCAEDKDRLNRKYCKFVAGSDQIWNPVFMKEDYHFLSFVNERKNAVAYGASIGVGKLTEEEQVLLRQGVSHISQISVREEAAADILEKLVGNRPQVVLDPTMLVEAEQWEKMERKPRKQEGDYLLLYYLGNISSERWKLLHRISEEQGLKIIVLGREEYSEYNTAGPAEFLYLVHHAKLVCTDSFHGCVFAILFQRPFYVFEREDAMQEMNSRIDTLLHTFSITDRRMKVGAEKYSMEMDFSGIRSVLERKREESYTFLKNALERG